MMRKEFQNHVHFIIILTKASRNKQIPHRSVHPRDATNSFHLFKKHPRNATNYFLFSNALLSAIFDDFLVIVHVQASSKA
jgi:hypothetical protein